jgi:micrococcal nuclease
VRGGPHATFDRPLPEGDYVVKRVIDAVTIVVSQKSQPDAGDRDRARAEKIEVSLIGVRLPETEAAGRPAEALARQAHDFTRKFLSGGEARLRFDRDKLDDDGRWRAYVFVRDKMLNEELVRQGLAQADRKPGDTASLARRIAKAEDEAERARLGLWAEPMRP